MDDRRMDEDTAALAREKAKHARVLVQQWQDEHSNVADYRVNDALEGLRKAERALDHLYRDEQYPEWEEARDKFVARLLD